MLREFRQFILRGNLIDLAFLLVAAVIFFLVVKQVNALMSRYRPEPASNRETRACPECPSDIPAAARRCAFCTAEQTA